MWQGPEMTALFFLGVLAIVSSELLPDLNTEEILEIERNISSVENGGDINVTKDLNNKTTTCDKPAYVYQSNGPVNIYLPAGVIPNANGSSFTTASRDNEKLNCSCPRGPPGKQGLQGIQGPRGEPGAPGQVMYQSQNRSDIPFAAFSAVIETRPFGPFQYYKIVDFDNIITNVGGGYDENRGTFTAPVSGFYMFQVHIHTITGHQAELRLMLNSKRVISLWADGTIGQDKAQKPVSPFMNKNTKTDSVLHEMGSSNSVVIHVKRSEKIYCLLPKEQVLAGLGFTSFSGHLMHTD